MGTLPRDRENVRQLMLSARDFCSKCNQQLVPTNVEFCALLGALSIVIEDARVSHVQKKKLRELRVKVSRVYKSSLGWKQSDTDYTDLRDLVEHLTPLTH